MAVEPGAGDEVEGGQPRSGCDEGAAARRVVLVTRPRAEAVSTARRLHQSGFRALIDPVLIVRPMAFVPPPVDDVAAVLLTSARAARALDDRLLDFPVLTVGRATAAAAERHGCRRVLASDGDGVALAELVIGRFRPDEGALLHLAGEDVRPGLAETVSAAGFTYRRVVVYRAEPAKGLTLRTLRTIDAGALDAVLLYSPRAAAIFVDLVREAGVERRLRDTRACCLSAEVAGRLEGVALHAKMIAARRTEDALLACLDTP